MQQLGFGHREHFRKAYLLPGLELGLLERTIPDKPQSSKQRYQLSAKGHDWVRRHSRS
jgi:ATP-dependent DNA helicase RecG